MNRTKLCFICLAFRLLVPAQAQLVQYTSDASGNLAQRGIGVGGIPQIVGQPQLQIVVPGDYGSFSVLLADSAGCAYQWRFFGTNLAGQTSDSLLVLNVTTNNQGPYTVVVTDSAGSVTSSVAQLYIDSNRNGLPDSWELTYFGNLNQNATGDFDGDGISNLQEFFDGTNPTNKTSFRSRLTLLGDGGLVSVTPEQASYAPTDTVSLTGTAFPPNYFFGWTGDLVTRSNPASLAMTTNKTVRACFTCQPAVAGLVGWWRGETDVSDFVGGHNGTFYAGTNTILAPSITSTGMVGSAFVFYGTNYIQVSDTNDLRPPLFTIEAWVYPNVQNASYQTVVAKGSAVNDDDTYYLGVVNGGASFWTKTSGSMIQLAGGSVPPNQWTHLAVTFDGSTKSLYVNGILVGTQGGLGPLTYDPQVIPVTIGADWVAQTPAYLFNGLLDEVSLFNRPLSANEINGLYIASVAGKCATRPVFTSSPQFADATQGTGYTQQVATVLGTLPISFSLSAGSLPAGLTISSSGQVSGVPTTASSNTFAVLATDAAGLSTELICGLRVLPVVVPVAVMPPGLVSWWRAENNALDAVGTNHGTLSNGVSFAAGEVGQAFLFNNTNQDVKVFASPSLNVGAGNGLSIEMWIKPTDLVNPRPLAEWNDGSTYGAHFWINASGGPGSLYANVRDTNLTDHIFYSAGGLLSSNAWQHVALTYDRTSGAAQMFLNGAVVASVNLGLFVPRTGVDLHLGYRPTPGTYSYQGLLDEPALYNRVLTATEVAALYNAGPLGKTSVGPYINTPPQLPDAVINQAYAQTIVAARGTAPTTFSLVGGALAPGLALSSTGVLSGTPTNAGAFSFAVRAVDNTSLAATQQFSVQVFAPVPPPPGLVSWWRAETNALDSSGTNNGVLRNGVAFTAGKIGQAFSLDGSSQSIDVADAPALRPASVTLETWALFTASGTRILLGKPVGSGTLDSYEIYISGGTLGAYVSDAASGGPAVSIPFSPVFGSWYHFAYTFDDASKQQALYLNGSQVASGIANKTIGYDNQPVLLGRDIDNGYPNFYFAGRLDEAAIYNRALGSNEVASLFNAGPAGKTAAGPAFATPPVLPVAVVSQSYTQTLALARGTAQTFVIVGGALPANLALSSAGVLSGVPVGAGTFSFVVRVTDNAALTADQPFTLQVLPKVSPPAGLVGWWRAENNALDSVGGNNGFLVNNATFAPGKVGQAFSLSGVNDAVEIEDSPALRPASVTIESWVMFFSPNGVQTIIAKTVGGGAGDSYDLWLENGNLKGMVSDITSANSPISVPFSPVVGQWYHVAFTFDDTTKQQILYLNGVAVAFGVSNLSIGYDAHPMFLGADYDNSSTMSLFLQGRIDEAAIYNRALSATEIASIYSADAAGKTVAGPYITTPPALPDAAYGVAYTQTVTSIRGAPIVAYALAGGALPGGLSFNSQGLLSGTPTNAGSFSFTVRATDAAGLFGDQAFSLRVAAQVPPAAGLVSWWRAENNALDSIGTNNGVALNGATYVPGKVGQAFSLDGINDCIQIPDSPGLRPASLTLETWVMFSANTGIRVIFTKPLGGGTLDSFALWLENGNLKAGICDTTGSGPALVAPFSPVVGQWYHLAYTFDDLTRQQVLYLNNVSVASGLSDRAIAYDTNPVLLGCDSDNGNHAWFVQGRIDEAAIYNRALTAPELAALYYAGVAGKTTVGPYFTTLPSLPDAIVNQAYSQTVTSTRGTPPVSYTLASGGLPPVLTFGSSGLLSGTPTSAGSFAFVARATDGAGLAADQFYTLNVFAPVPVPPGLLAWWRAENNALDSAGTNNGTLINGASFAAGKVGSAFSLNGTNAFVAVSNSAWLNPAGAFSVELWIKASLQQFSPDGLWLFVDKSHGFADGTGWGMEGNTDGTASFFFGKGGSSSPANFTSATTFSSVRDDHWHHLAGVFTGTQLAIYLDGVIQGNLAVTNIPAGNARDVEIGRSWGGGSPLRYFHGLLDEISYYNRALSSSEVAGIYSAGAAGKQLPSGLLLRASLQGNAVSLSFPSTIGVAYTVQSETSLSSSSWSVLSNLTALDTNITVTFPVAGSPQRFYRVMTTGN
jgi:hypothetical protein